MAAGGELMTDRLLKVEDLAKILGYSCQRLFDLRSQKSDLIAGLPTFKLCDCEATRRKTQARCNHPFYAWESEVQAFLKGRQERYRVTTGRKD